MGGLPRTAPGATAAVFRLGKVADFERLFGPWHDHPTLVAAAVALMNGVPRVVVAPTLALLEDIEHVAILGAVSLASIHRPTEREALVDFDAAMSLTEIASAKARGVRVVHPAGAVLLPGARHMTPVGGAALALPLCFGQAQLGPLVELRPTPIADDLITAGVLMLTQRSAPRSSPRVALPWHETRLRPPAEASGPLAHLEGALSELAQRYTHRLRDPRSAGGASDLATVRRDAERLLQAERVSGVITGYALSIEPVGDDLVIEVAVTLPKRVGKVIIRVAQQ